MEERRSPPSSTDAHGLVSEGDEASANVSNHTHGLVIVEGEALPVITGLIHESEREDAESPNLDSLLSLLRHEIESPASEFISILESGLGQERASPSSDSLEVQVEQEEGGSPTFDSLESIMSDRERELQYPTVSRVSCRLGWAKSASSDSLEEAVGRRGNTSDESFDSLDSVTRKRKGKATSFDSLDGLARGSVKESHSSDSLENLMEETKRNGDEVQMEGDKKGSQTFISEMKVAYTFKKGKRSGEWRIPKAFGGSATESTGTKEDSRVAKTPSAITSRTQIIDIHVSSEGESPGSGSHTTVEGSSSKSDTYTAIQESPVFDSLTTDGGDTGRHDSCTSVGGETEGHDSYTSAGGETTCSDSCASFAGETRSRDSHTSVGGETGLYDSYVESESLISFNIRAVEGDSIITGDMVTGEGESLVPDNLILGEGDSLSLNSYTPGEGESLISDSQTTNGRGSPTPVIQTLGDVKSLVSDRHIFSRGGYPIPESYICIEEESSASDGHRADKEESSDPDSHTPSSVQSLAPGMSLEDESLTSVSQTVTESASSRSVSHASFEGDCSSTGVCTLEGIEFSIADEVPCEPPAPDKLTLVEERTFNSLLDVSSESPVPEIHMSVEGEALIHDKQVTVAGELSISDSHIMTEAESPVPDVDATAEGKTPLSDFHTYSEGESPSPDSHTTFSEESILHAHSAPETSIPNSHMTTEESSMTSSHTTSLGRSSITDSCITPVGESLIPDSQDKLSTSVDEHSVPSGHMIPIVQSPIPDNHATTEGESPRPDSRATSVGEVLSQDSRTTIERDSPMPDIRAPSVGDFSTSDSRTTIERDSPMPDSRAASVGDFSTSDSHTTTEGESPRPDSRQPSVGEFSTSDSHTTAEGESPRPDSRQPSVEGFSTSDSHTTAEGESPRPDSRQPSVEGFSTSDSHTTAEGESPRPDSRAPSVGEASTFDSHTTTEGESPRPDSRQPSVGDFSSSDSHTTTEEESLRPDSRAPSVGEASTFDSHTTTEGESPRPDSCATSVGEFSTSDSHTTTERESLRPDSRATSIGEASMPDSFTRPTSRALSVGEAVTLDSQTTTEKESPSLGEFSTSVSHTTTQRESPPLGEFSTSDSHTTTERESPMPHSCTTPVGNFFTSDAQTNTERESPMADSRALSAGEFSTSDSHTTTESLRPDSRATSVGEASVPDSHTRPATRAFSVGEAATPDSHTEIESPRPDNRAPSVGEPSISDVQTSEGKDASFPYSQATSEEEIPTPDSQITSVGESSILHDTLERGETEETSSHIQTDLDGESQSSTGRSIMGKEDEESPCSLEGSPDSQATPEGGVGGSPSPDVQASLEGKADKESPASQSHVMVRHEDGEPTRDHRDDSLLFVMRNGRAYIQQGVQRIQGPTQMMPVGLPAGASPPVFEQIFRNARFAQGGDAMFEGKVQGNPKPTVTWTRKGAQIVSGNKYQVTHDENTGVVTLNITAIGPGDEGEYTCTAANQYGEAICTVYIQPEAAYMMQQQRQSMQMQQSKSMMQQQQMSQTFSQQQQQMMSVQNGHMESFRVDTFEYRLLHEVEFRRSLTVTVAGELEVDLGAIQGPPQAPQLQQKPRSTKVSDGGNATFTVNVNGYPTPRVIWFKNGVGLQQSDKYLMTQSAGQVTLVVKQVNSQDSGYYTMLAENSSGCTVASAQLAVVPRGEITNGAPSPEVIRPERIEQQQAQQQMEVDTGEESGKSLEPKFVRGPADREVQEGKLVRFDARCSGRPYPEVTWYINGQLVADDATHKVLVNEAGNHSLMISKASLSDAGVITCVAKNKSGEANFQCQLNVLEMQQMVAPKFVERFQQGAVAEGETVVLQCRAVGTPMPFLTWQKDGVSVENNPNIMVQSDQSGASTLQILSASGSDAGWYQCNAQNSAGSAATRARLHVQTTKPSGPAQPQRPHFPKPVKFIEPEPEPEPEVIMLRPVERAHHVPKAPEEEQPVEPPKFTHPLRDIDIVEGTRAHFEAKVTPVGDATMNIEWLIDGKPLAASSRATVTYRFGFVALDILNVIKADAGVYTCRATNAKGQAETSANLRITERPLIESQTQHPEALQQISYLEDQSRYQRTVSIEESSTIKPSFVKPLANLGEVMEGKYAHFEAQLHPVSDPFMRIEWFKDGKPITASSRINVIYNFGYVALNIMHLRPEDSGTYTVRATNKAGECTCQASIQVITLSSVTGDLGIPEQAQHIRSVEEMEAYRLQMQQRTAQEIAEAATAPVFKTELKDATAREGGYAHFEARLEPIGDPNLKVEWLKDGRPIEASSRITSFFNFGYVALTVKALIIKDAGTYTCLAKNSKGEAQVTAQLTVLSKTDTEVETQYQETVAKMQYLEDSSRYQRTETEETSAVTMPPKFLGPLKGTNKIVEGQKAHFEIRLEPQSDSTMTVEWYFNGQVIMSASRIKTYHDFGYVSLDISDVRQSDAGQYTVVARNALGQAQMSTVMTIETRSAIDTTSMHEVTLSKTSAMERRHQEPQYDIEEISKSKPEFTQLLADPKPLPEGKNVHLEARLEPMNDPTMKVEWFFNGKPITIGSRFKTYFDFGFVALDIIGVYTTDSGEYTCRAENVLGSAHTSACVRVIGTGDILSESMHDNAMEQIHYLEDASRHQRSMQEQTEINEAPTFVKSLKNIETVEGTNIHLEARLKPVGDSSMRIDWFFNDEPLKVGHRFRPAYDFDYVALDLLSVYPIDSGIYTCRATNRLGQAVTSASVKVTAKKDLVFDSEHPDSLQKLQYLDDSSRYQRRETMEEVSVKIKPRFLTQIKNVTLKEGMNAHFEAKIEPITDPNLRIDWYRNGMPIQLGSRFRLIHDFGYVALDISRVIEEDSGTYTCVATNLMGKDEITADLKVLNSASIVMESQNQTMTMEQLQMLEDRSKYSRTEQVEETTKQAPVFTTSLKNIEILEGQRAHFELKLIPTSDPTMKVEWFHNNVPVKSGSRFTEYNDFGFVALDIMYCYAEDSGTYTCMATNCMGQAISTGTLVCHTKDSILSDTMNTEAMSKISRLESSRTQRTITTEEITMQAPVFTAPLRDQQLIENAPLHFEARLIPVGDPDLKVEWFKNNVPIQQANRISTMHDFGYVALDMKYVNPEDSGTYTCRATNRLGQAVTTASLVVTSKESLLMETQHSEALEKLRYLEDSSRYTKSTTEETVITQAPKFVVKLSGLTTLWEGQSAHVECRLEPYPDPSMKVEWFHNGNALQVGHRFRTMYDFGFCAMDILQAVAEDSGTYEVRATNRIGTATSSITIEVKPKSDFIVDTQHPEAMAKITRLEQKAPHRLPEDAVVIEKPNFGRPLRNQDHLIEGQSIHMEATLTPVNDPTMKVEWFFNGQPIPQGHRFRTTYDFGFVALDILYAYPEDCGTYMCKATNAAGQAVTSCSIKVEGTGSMQLDTVDEERLRKIRQLEAMGHKPQELKDQVFQKPIFTTPLTSVDNLVEGERCHLECRLEPINDPDLKVEWYVNGVEIKAGHRFRTTHDFGYVALDILYSYAEDSGTYLCKATNKMGEAVNSCNVKVSARRSIYLDTQHPMGWEKIQNLEQRGRYERIEVSDVPMQPPRFTSELRANNTLLSEGQHVHLEGRVEPVHDPSMRVEWYHEGKALQSAARFHTTFDFGYVALDITTVYAEDSGEYTCRAFNHMGEAQSSVSFRVEGKEGVITESARPEGLEKIRELEDSARYGRQVSEEVRTFQRPVFTQPLQNLDNLTENETAHFECRLIPVGDPNLKVEWFRNEKPIETSSRINRTHDFGYVALDISGVRADDEGIYMCRAYNDLGEAVTTASIKIKSHATIQMETQHPEGMKKIQALEERKPTGRGDESDKVYDKPVFTATLAGPAQIMEGQSAHYECRVVPVGDPNMRYEWYCNGVELKMGSRFKTTSDFGYVTLDILQCVAEDSGVYMCKAINLAGEAVSSCSTRVLAKDSILGDVLHPGWETIKLREAQWNRVPQTPTSPEALEPPMFTKHLESHERLQESGMVRLEAQVQPANDPHLSIEWFKNSVQLVTGPGGIVGSYNEGTRIRSTFDFGHVTLEISGLREDDSGIYTCKAVNRVGEAVSTCNIKVFGRDWLIGESMHPEALSKIAQLEQPAAGPGSPDEPTFDVPVFISHLNNVECREGDTAHFECKVQPCSDPTMKIEWFINGKPMQAAARYQATYDFGFVSLDCTHCYAEDSGIYMCRATNAKGSATTTGTLTCISKANLYFDTQHPQGRAGLEAVEEAERAYWAKYQRQMSEREVSFPKPFFVRPLQTNFSLNENQALHMEANVEPKQDPDLKIEWFLNGKVLEQASRYKTSYDFGLVTLDLSDVYERDQGIYTCRAYNKAGEAFCTTTVVVVSKDVLIEGTQHPAGEAGLEAIQRMENKLRRDDRALPDEEGHPPVFTVPFKDLSNMEEGEIAHFEAMLTPVGDESMKVEWFFKGEALKASHRVRTVYAFGMVVLEILGTKISDSGEYTCRASNKWGKAECSVNLECVDRAHGQPPKFTTHIQSLEGLKDGDSAHFECTLVPIGDPNMKVEWFHNGEPLRNATRIKTVSDFGFVVLDIAYLQNHDAGEWMCKASNKYGEDTTKAFLNCYGKGGVYTESLQPGSLDKIAALEGQKAGLKAPTTPSAAEPPKFITQIANIERLVEGQSAHFEARLKPVNDPNLVVEWFKDGKKLPTGHRYRTFHDFGIVILDILYCYEEDSGVYEARAVNKLGEDKTTANLKCLSKTNLILTPQVPKGMEGGLQKLQTLEDTAWMRRESVTSERVGMAPKFTVPLNNIDNMKEGENAHFEARLVPTDDPRLKVEWYWNGKPMKYSSRIRQFCDFGFVIMEVSPVYPEDSGEYMCRAYNDYGEAVTKAYLKCEGKRSVILESQLPKSMQKGMERIAELEGLMIKSPDMGTPSESGQPPQFVTQPQDCTILENQLAHFECRLLPVGDPYLRVEWYHNGRPLRAGSRIKTINDFGYVILELAGCYSNDSGTYTCRAINKHGEASVECKLTVSSKSGIILDPQATSKFKGCTESIQKLEESMYKKERAPDEEEKPCPPNFVTQLENITDLVEGQPAHFDCRVEPVGDPTMRIEWFHNGMPLAAGSRVHMMDDFGFVVLDLEWTFARDTGEYICRATNKWGQATTKATLNVRSKHGVDLSTQLPQGMTAEKLKELERGPLTEKYDADAEMTPPKFTVPIKSQAMQEGERAFFEARVEPRNDPNLRIEWYHNGKPLQSGHRFRTNFELGHVTLELLHTYAEDSGEYVCRAYNKLGQDITRASLKSKAGQSVVLQSQVPKGMKTGQDFASQMEETLKKYCKEVMLTQEDIYEPEKRQPPRFVTHIKDVRDLQEMAETKFDCQLAPVGDPHMKVEWFFNGRPLPYKNRFTPIYDFGYVALVMNWVFGEDSGEYLCRATNKWGMDETRATLKATGRPGVIYDSQIPKGMQSLEKIRELEASWSQHHETHVDEEKPRVKPEVLKKPESLVVQEGDWARFSVRISGYPKPRVMWIVNGSTAMSGNRFKIWYDGLFHLDIPKTRQYDNGKVEVICRNSLGECYACCDLKVMPRQDDYRAVLKNSPKPWYDYDLKSYQKERQETELDRVFEERIDSDYSILHESKFGEYMARPVDKTEETEWQKLAREKNAGEKIKQLEDTRRVNRKNKDVKMFASPLEHAAQHSLAKGMASCYEEQLDTVSAKQQQPLQRPKRILREAKDVRHEQQYPPREPEPSESTVHGKEIHTATQKQTQKEIKGDLEITRKITATETTEMEHTGKTTERIVEGPPLKPAKPPFFTRKIQPCRVFERERGRFEVEFDGDPNPTVQWYREDFPITSSPDFQIHTFGDKSILMIREVFMEDSGVFAVVAENRGGRAKCSANLVVEERKQRGAGAVPPSFYQTIQDTMSQPGNLVRLDAKVSGTPPIDIYWLKNGRKLVQDMHYKMVKEQETCTLLIIEAVPEDSGSYECVAINKAGEARCQATVEVAGPRPAQAPKTPTTPAGATQAPTIVRKLQSQIVQEGQPAAFECVVPASPQPKVQWMKGKEPIKQSKYFTMTSDGEVHCLKISEAFPEDEGNYYCIISNTIGKCTLEANLQVVQPQQAEVAPTIAPLEDVTVEEGEGVRFNTVVIGSPMPTVQWYREGALIPHSRDFEMFMEGNTAVLDIKLTYPEDTGTFTCRATNSAGQAETSSMLTVKTRSKDKPRGEPPKFLVPLQPQKVKHGEKVVLETSVRGLPTPRVIWYHLDKEVVPSPEFVQEHDATSGRVVLTIKEVFIDDKGLYRCLAVNEFGRDETAGYVTVEDIEVLEKCELRQAPRITLPLQPKILKKHSSLDLLARYEAFPPPTVKWYHQGKELKPSRDYLIETIEDETSLHVEEVFEDDYGEYEVRIFNEAGEARTVASVLITQPLEVVEMEPPMFIKPLHPQIVPEGEVAILEAEVTAKPEAEFKWYRHGQEITHDEELEVQITSDNNKSSLVLGELFEDDSGDYTVTAQNPVGRASSTATLLVEGEGDEEAEPPAFDPPLTPIRVMDGEEVRFRCKVTGKPMPKLTWLQNGRPIAHHREVRLTQTPDGKAGLQILEVFPEDAGDYTCIARNKAGEARSTANLAVESYEYVPDSEAATTTSVSEKNVLSGPVSEEEETIEIEKDTESDSSEAGSAPYFCNKLEQKIEVVEGTSVRLLVKVTGYPRPTIKWHTDGVAVEVTETRTVETYEDGTSALTLHKTTLEDCGEYVCEAMNRNGVDTTVTTLVVLPEHTEGTSTAYRKPEWVTRMEELKEAMSGEQYGPQFTKEITNSRVREMETITFTASFRGNPKPDITWYHNSKIIRQQQCYQMRVRNDKAMLTIVEARPEFKGEYSCRAANSEGEVFTRAQLDVIELTYEEKLKVSNERYAAVNIQHAAEHMKEKERERALKLKKEHEEAMARLKQEKVNRAVQRQQELEDAKKNVWKPKVVEEVKEVKRTPKERCVAELYSNWTQAVSFEDNYPELQPDEFAPNQIPGVKCFVKVSETSIKGEEVVREVAPQFFEDEQIIHELAKVHTLLKNNVRVNEIWSMFRAGEFKALQQPNIQSSLIKVCEYIGHQRNVSIVLAEEIQEQAKKHPVGLKAFLRMLKYAKNVKPDTLFKDVIPREMGKWSSTTQELTQVSQMLNKGIQTEEIIASCVAGKLPTLKKPETQQPLVNIVEKHGHSVMVAQVLVEEAYRDAKDERVLAEQAWEVIHEQEMKIAEVSEVRTGKASLGIFISPVSLLYS
ncbi:titin-like isoform X7 [Penaeus japonicus]|uniref:titin-like isoform X7 n=1 Tax=Penaeus japonicus TaxID=27405 RepID=UPI001C70C1F9|nr:titin-like isoform X7 [Penaeus japonicus]